MYNIEAKIGRRIESAKFATITLWYAHNLPEEVATLVASELERAEKDNNRSSRLAAILTAEILLRRHGAELA